MAGKGMVYEYRRRGKRKKTRQGCGVGTKFGNKSAKGLYIKKYRGQGGSKRSKR